MKLDFKKILTPGGILLAATVILGIVSLIIYGVNVSSVGYFQGLGSGAVVATGILAVLFGVVAIASSLFHFDGIVGKIVDGLRSVLSILVPVLLMVCLLSFISIRAEGLAFIYGSDANALEEVQSPENMASASTAITGFIFFGISAIFGIVASFFNIPKKETEAVSEQQA